MNDLISRQAAIDALLKIINERDSVYFIGAIYTAVDAIKDLPSAQPEIIRCKDCKYADLTYDGDVKYCDMVRDDDDFHIEVYYDGNHYCSFAERETDDER